MDFGSHEGQGGCLCNIGTQKYLLFFVYFILNFIKFDKSNVGKPEPGTGEPEAKTFYREPEPVKKYRELELLNLI